MYASSHNILMLSLCYALVSVATTCSASRRRWNCARLSGYSVWLMVCKCPKFALAWPRGPACYIRIYILIYVWLQCSVYQKSPYAAWAVCCWWMCTMFVYIDAAINFCGVVFVAVVSLRCADALFCCTHFIYIYRYSLPYVCLIFTAKMGTSWWWSPSDATIHCAASARSKRTLHFR